ncbi:hypothetical protein RYX36_012063, partial [Vicia faba]
CMSMRRNMKIVPSVWELSEDISRDSGEAARAGVHGGWERTVLLLSHEFALKVPCG